MVLVCAAAGADHGGRDLFKIVAERIIGGKKEPGVIAGFDYCGAGAVFFGAGCVGSLAMGRRPAS
jgi:hypothetical protein